MIEIHPLALLLPEMPPKQYESFKADIRERGLLEPIKVVDVGGRRFIVDGRHRERVCRELKIEPKTEVLPSDTDVLAVIKSANLERRHLNESQRAMYAARLESYRWGANQYTTKEMPRGMSRSEAARHAGSHVRTVARARVVLDCGTPELIKAVETGALVVSLAESCTQLPAKTQRSIGTAKDPAMAARTALLEAKRSETRSQIESIRARQAKPVHGKYDVLVFDPPWPSEMWMERLTRNRSNGDSGYGQHAFPTMQCDQIEQFIQQFIPQHAAENCHIFIWVTEGFFREALRIIEGVEGVSLGRPLQWVWKKDGGPKPPGLPVYNAEFIIYACKGSPKFIDGPNFKTCFEAKRRGLSVKPDEFYDMIRAHTAGRRLDVFNRRKIEGFDGWGLESPNMYVEGSRAMRGDENVDAEVAP